MTSLGSMRRSKVFFLAPSLLQEHAAHGSAAHFVVPACLASAMAIVAILTNSLNSLAFVPLACVQTQRDIVHKILGRLDQHATRILVLHVDSK